MRKVLVLASVLILAGCPKKPAEEVGPLLPPSGGGSAPVTVQTQKPPEVDQMTANFSKIFFEFDQSTLTQEGMDALKANAAIMQKATDIKLEVQGHADERGTTDYNLALGQKRADAVYRYMIAEGVAPSRLATISYGEERPVDASHTEVAWSKNRRAEFRITWGGGPSLQGTTH
jgi:peptidoglycan-associated lipoprotein